MMDKGLANDLILRIWKMQDRIRELSREVDALEAEIASAVEDE